MKVEKMWDLFMFVNVPEGEHTYEMTFFPAWMDYGLYLCGLACLGFVAVMVVWRKKSKMSAVAADAPDNLQTPDVSDNVQTPDIPDQPGNVQTPDIPTESDAMQTLTVSDDVQTPDVPDDAQTLTVPDDVKTLDVSAPPQ